MIKDQMVHIRLDGDEKFRLSMIAKQKGIGISTLIRMIIREYLMREERKQYVNQ